MEDNNKKDLNEHNENKGKDLSEQLDKLFSSLNLSRKKDEPVKTQVEPEATSLADDSSVEKMFWGDTKAPESSNKQASESQPFEATEDLINLHDVEEFTVTEDISSTKSLEDELNALFVTDESSDDTSVVLETSKEDENNSYEKEDIDINGIINTLDDISLETESVSIDEDTTADFDVTTTPNFNSSEVDSLNDGSQYEPIAESISESNLTEEKPLSAEYDFNMSDSYANQTEKSKGIHNLIDDELQKQIDDLKETGYQGQGFVYEEGVNSETIPSVEEHIETSELGGIDYDKMVGQNHLMNIESIYDCHNLIRQMSETVFMIELYGRTLPENLPIDVKRESVLSIIRASSIQIDDLLSDAYQRIDVLNEVLEDVAQKAEELDTENKAEIEMLEEKIQDLKNRIEKRTQYKQSQNAMIGYEIQRIVNIVEFIEPE